MSRTRDAYPGLASVPDGGFTLTYHLEMVADQKRVEAMIGNLCGAAGGRLLDVGTGSGVLALSVADQFDEVVGIDIDVAALGVARSNAARLGLTDRVKFLALDALDLSPANVGVFDAVVVEMMSIWLIQEPQILVVDHLHRSGVLRKGASITPQVVHNMLEIGWFEFGTRGVLVEVPITEFATPQNFAPVAPSIHCGSTDLRQPQTEPNDKWVTIERSVIPFVNATVNSVRLTSLVQMAQDRFFFGSPTLMPATILPFSPVQVVAGQEYKVSVRFLYGRPLNEVEIELRFPESR